MEEAKNWPHVVHCVHSLIVGESRQHLGNLLLKTALNCYGWIRGASRALHVPRDPKSALAYSKLDVIAPVGSDIEAGGDKADEETDDEKNKP